jgi:DNA-binding transcriptional LysR family regulator
VLGAQRGINRSVDAGERTFCGNQSMATPEDPAPSQGPAFAVLRAFEAVGRLGGIRRAALALDLDHAVVSRHLRALEKWAGVPLINRQRDAQILTETGARYHQRITRALEEIAQASAELISIRNQGVLRIWCMPGLALGWLTARLPRFQALVPQVELVLRPHDTSPDFARYEADVDLHYFTGLDSVQLPARCEARRLEIARPEVFPVASPLLARALRPIAGIEDLLHAPLLHEESAAQWRAWFSACGVACPENLAGPRLSQAHLAVEAARHGQGVALANPFLIGDDLSSGRLVPVLDKHLGGRIPLGVYAFSARADRWQSRSVAELRRWLLVEIAKTLEQPPTAGTGSVLRFRPRGTPER